MSIWISITHRPESVIIMFPIVCLPRMARVLLMSNISKNMPEEMWMWSCTKYKNAFSKQTKTIIWLEMSQAWLTSAHFSKYNFCY